MIQIKTDKINRKHRLAVSLCFFLAGFIFASWASRIPDIQARLHLNDAQLGSTLFILPIGLMLSLAIAGALITRFGSRTVLLISGALFSISLVGIGFVSTTLQLSSVLIFFGISCNLLNISVNTQAVATEKLYHKPIMASFHGVWSLAGFTGAAVGSVMVSNGLNPDFHFILAGIAGLIMLVVSFPNTLKEAKNSQQGPVFVLPDRYILQYGIIAFCCLLCEGTMFDWSGVYFAKIVGASDTYRSLGYVAFMGCMATGRFLADSWVAKFGAKKILQFSGICISTGLLLSVFFPTIIMATLGFMMVGFGVCSVVPTVYSLAGKSKSMNPGQAIAAVSTVGFAGFLIGPPLIGYLAQATSLQWSFALVALVGLGTTLFAGRIKD